MLDNKPINKIEDEIKNEKNKQKLEFLEEIKISETPSK